MIFDSFPKPQQKSGALLIKEFAKTLPEKPGVYRMYSQNNDILYIGKARNLKRRVSDYTRPEGHSVRIQRMIHATYNMEFIVTNTETEALLLEANLIKHLNPRYNILLRDDKSLPYILITDHYRAPGLYKHRGAHTIKGDYFGPFACASAVTRTMNILQRAFLLRSCNDNAFENRTRPCLLYQIKRCSGPCTKEISDDDYAKLVEEVKAFLKGKNQAILDNLAQKMQNASKRLEYEQAALYRDRISALAQMQTQQFINLSTVQEADAFAFFEKDGTICIEVFFFRFGQNWGNRAYFPKADIELTPGEIVSNFIAQFYSDKPLPKLILVSHELTQQKLLKEALSLKAQRNVTILKPNRGEKKEVIEHVLLNAKEALARKLAQSSTQKYLFEEFTNSFQLPYTPRRIEIYDNSHIMGSHAIGAMVVAGLEGFIKNQYRKFNIRSQEITPGDDYGMMKEVIKRRFSRLIKEHAEEIENKNADNNETENDAGILPAWPDVLLIDGGIGQLNAVENVLKELEIAEKISLIAIAKGPDRNAGRETFFMPNKPPFSLPEKDPILYFVQRLRDEAHRFALGVHKAKRKKDVFTNPLDEIDNIGPARKRALLNHFGSAKAIAQAAVADLMKVKGISETMARNILAHLNKT